MIEKKYKTPYREGRSKRRQMSTEEKIEIINLWRSGVSVYSLAKQYNRTTAGLYKFLKVNNIIR